MNDRVPSLVRRVWSSGRHPLPRSPERKTHPLRLPPSGRPLLTSLASFDPAQYRQTTATTCGAMSLLAAHRLLHPTSTASESAVARWTRGGFRRGAGFIWPWPKAFGTSPWAAAKAMNIIAGRRYRVLRVDPDSSADRVGVLTRCRDAVDAGLPVPLYAGSGLLPRHVVLVLCAAEDSGTISGIRLLEPGAGVVVWVSAEDFIRGNFALGGWRRLWAAILPDPSRG